MDTNNLALTFIPDEVYNAVKYYTALDTGAFSIALLYTDDNMYRAYVVFGGQTKKAKASTPEALAQQILTKLNKHNSKKTCLPNHHWRVEDENAFNARLASFLYRLHNEENNNE